MSDIYPKYEYPNCYSCLDIFCTKLRRPRGMTIPQSQRFDCGVKMGVNDTFSKKNKISNKNNFEFESKNFNLDYIFIVTNVTVVSRRSHIPLMEVKTK